MRCEPENRVYKVSYPFKGSLLARVTGILLIAAGILLIVLCVPLWAWMALIGTGLIFWACCCSRNRRCSMAVRVVCVKLPRGIRQIARLFVKKEKRG